MKNTHTGSRTRAALLALAGTLALAALVAVPAWAKGPTPETLSAAGWVCFQPPVPRIVCGNPGVGVPFPGNPDPPPSYNLLTFDLDGAFLGTVHLIRADLYASQPCPRSDGPYVFIDLIGYYECLRA